jgi:hypothetical protein
VKIAAADNSNEHSSNAISSVQFITCMSAGFHRRPTIC